MLGRRRRRPSRGTRSGTGLRLHIGSGGQRLPGWVNVDVQALAGVDVVADVTAGLPFDDGSAEFVYAEHFLEHLRFDDGIAFLVEAHRVLAHRGVLRLSTPNLDWVWETHYDPEAPPGERVEAALRANRAFHGWGHRFLWNPPILERALVASGFDDLRWCRWGESARAELQGIERHRAHGDTGHHQHVVVVEASRAGPKPELRAELGELAQRELIRHIDAR